MDGLSSISSVESKLLDPCAFGHIALVPSATKNKPITVSSFALAPRHASWMVVVSSSRKSMHALEQGWPSAKSSMVQGVRGVL